MSNDIIEVGDDGIFDMPIHQLTTEPTRSKTVFKSAKKPTNIFDSIVEGEYKIYKKKDNKVVILLHSNSTVTTIRLNNNLIIVECMTKESYTIKLPFKVNVEEGNVDVKSFENYAVISLSSDE